MTFADRLLGSSVWALPTTAIALGLTSNLTGWDAPGVALFFVILIWPPALLIVTGALVVAQRLRGAPARLEGVSRRPLVTFHGQFLKMGLMGIGGFVALLVFVGISDGTWLAELPLSVRTGIMLLIALVWILWPGNFLWMRLTGRSAVINATLPAREGRFEEALDRIQGFTRSRPNDPLTWEGLALSLAGLSRHEQALEAADRGLALSRRWQGLLIRGQILMALGAGEEALADLAECHRRKRLPFTQMLIGSVMMGFRRTDEALELIQKSNRSIHASFLLALLGDAHRLAGHQAAAESAYRDAESRALQEIAAGPPLGWPVLAGARLHLGDFHGAMEAVGKSLEAFPDDSSALCTRAMIFARRREGEAAITALVTILPEHPGAVVGTLTDPANTHLLAEAPFRQALAWAMGAHKLVLQRVRNRPAALAGASARS